MWDEFLHVSGVPLCTTVMLLLNAEFNPFKHCVQLQQHQIKRYKQLSHWLAAGTPILDVSEMFSGATVYGALDTDDKFVRGIAPFSMLFTVLAYKVQALVDHCNS